MVSGDGFVAEVDHEAWRRGLVPALGGAAVVVVVGVVLLITGWVVWWLSAGVVLAALVVAGVKVGGFVARRKRRESPLVVDDDGVRLPTARGSAFLPWDTIREVVVDGPTLRFRVRAGVTPGTHGVEGLHRRDAWPVASGPGLPVDTRLFSREREDILGAVGKFSGGRVWSSDR